jgi:hypothetical protein
MTKPIVMVASFFKTEKEGLSEYPYWMNREKPDGNFAKVFPQNGQIDFRGWP